MGNAHYSHFNGKHRRSGRSAEQRGKACSHAAHYEHGVIVPVEFKWLSQRGDKASAQLERRTLSACRTAQQMGYQRGYENKGRSFYRYLFFSSCTLDDAVGAVVVVHSAELVEPHDNNAAQREKHYEKRICSAYLGHLVKSHMEKRAYNSYENARAYGYAQPFQENGVLVQDIFPVGEYPFESHNIPPIILQAQGAALLKACRQWQSMRRSDRNEAKARSCQRLRCSALRQ